HVGRYGIAAGKEGVTRRGSGDRVRVAVGEAEQVFRRGAQVEGGRTVPPWIGILALLLRGPVQRPEGVAGLEGDRGLRASFVRQPVAGVPRERDRVPQRVAELVAQGELVLHVDERRHVQKDLPEALSEAADVEDAALLHRVRRDHALHVGQIDLQRVLRDEDGNVARDLVRLPELDRERWVQKYVRDLVEVERGVLRVERGVIGQVLDEAQGQGNRAGAARAFR